MTLEEIKKCAPSRFEESGQFKALVKEALKEWLDEKLKELGWWSFKSIAAAALAALAYFIFWANGFHK